MHGHRPEMECPGSGRSTVVTANEHGVVLRYPGTFGSSLVESPYGKLGSSESTCTNTKPRRRRKAKKRRQLNQGEVLQLKYFEKMRSQILIQYESLLQAAKSVGYIPIPPVGLQTDEVACESTSALNLQEVCDYNASASNTTSESVVSLTSDCVQDVCGKMVCNSTGRDITVKDLNSSFLIPSHCSFLLSDIQNLDILTDYAASRSIKFNLIVIDPPWENRSVIRGKKYHWISNEQLLGIQIPELAAPGALVVVWVTNKRRLAEFVQQSLFPAWSVAMIGEWHWIKVTTSGELVYDIDSVHKKPFETLVIGRFLSSNRLEPVDPAALNDTVHQPDSRPPHKKPKLVQPVSPGPVTPPTSSAGAGTGLQVQDQSNIPLHNSLLCVPSKVHSQKPHLGDVFSRYLPVERNCLELFARNLFPGWTSWGNEVLKFQEISCDSLS